MKKTLITAALALSFAVSASAASALDGAFTMDTFTTGGAQTLPAGTTFSTPTETTPVYQQLTMTMVFNTEKLAAALEATTSTQSQKAVEIAYNSNTNKLGLGFRVEVATDGTKTLKAVLQTGQSWHSYIPTSDLSSMIEDNETLVLTLVLDGSAGTSLYTYNPEANTVTSSGTKTDAAYQSSYQFNSMWLTDNAWAEALDSVYIFDSAKTPTDILAISKAVPEPATATLSLLALAGLAARRRRQ